MNPYIGDRQLEPDEEPDRPMRNCEACDGWGWIEFDGEHNGCAECDGSGVIEMTYEELSQKQFDDFDPPDRDYGDEL